MHNVSTMTDTTINQPSIASLEEVVKNQTSNVERIENAIMAFSNTVIQALTGAASTTAPKAASVAPAAGAKRRGRPPGSVNRVKAAPAKPELAPMTNVALEAVELVKKAKRMTQSDLAEHFKMERSLIEHHMLTAIEHGAVVCLKVKRPGQHKQILYYRPDWVSIKGL